MNYKDDPIKMWGQNSRIHLIRFINCFHLGTSIGIPAPPIVYSVIAAVDSLDRWNRNMCRVKRRLPLSLSKGNRAEEGRESECRGRCAMGGREGGKEGNKETREQGGAGYVHELL